MLGVSGAVVRKMHTGGSGRAKNDWLEKACADCGIVQMRAAYPGRNNSLSICRSCYNIKKAKANRERYAADPEYRQKKRDYHREYQAEYAKANETKVKDYFI